MQLVERDFQSAHGGEGLSRAEMSEAYWNSKKMKHATFCHLTPSRAFLALLSACVSILTPPFLLLLLVATANKNKLKFTQSWTLERKHLSCYRARACVQG
jgi:hypothetical protein